MNSKINKLMIDGLEFIHVENDPKKPAVMLLHGYGASMDDLFPLFEYLAKDWNWFFPNAPLEVPIGPMMSGRAWFPIDMEALNAAMMSGQHRDFRNLSSDDFKNMVGQMEPIIANIQRQYPKFILGGFSQGAMLTSHLGPRLAVDGMILWSANLIDEDNMKLERNIPFIQSHGAQDPLLGIDGARGLYTKLKEGGFAGEFIEFAGEHTIPTEVIEKTKDFLTKVG